MQENFRSSKMIGALTALLIWSLGGPAARGIDLSGMVREVTGDVAMVVIEGDFVPAAGDKVEIFFKLAGADDEISVGHGKVSAVNRRLNPGQDRGRDRQRGEGSARAHHLRKSKKTWCRGRDKVRDASTGALTAKSEGGTWEDHCPTLGGGNDGFHGGHVW